MLTNKCIQWNSTRYFSSADHRHTVGVIAPSGPSQSRFNSKSHDIIQNQQYPISAALFSHSLRPLIENRSRRIKTTFKTILIHQVDLPICQRTNHLDGIQSFLKTTRKWWPSCRKGEQESDIRQCKQFLRYTLRLGTDERFKFASIHLDLGHDILFFFSFGILQNTIDAAESWRPPGRGERNITRTWFEHLPHPDHFRLERTRPNSTVI